MALQVVVTPAAELLGSAAELPGMLRWIVLGTTRVYALRERVAALKAVGAHAATWCLLAVLAGGGSTSSSLLGGGGADGLLELLQLGHDSSNVDLDIPDGNATAGVRSRIAVLQSSGHAANVCRQLSLADDKLRVLVVAVVVLHVDVRPVTTRAFGANEGP